jgi:hypothetical protein
VFGRIPTRLRIQKIKKLLPFLLIILFLPKNMADEPKINVVRLCSVRYRHLNLEKAVTFFEDFGLVPSEVYTSGSIRRVHFSGYGIDPYCYVAEQSAVSGSWFFGSTWAVESLNNLETASQFPTATKIKNNESLGGGKIVQIDDSNGFLITSFMAKN